MTQKPEFTREIEEVILEALVTAPSSQLSARLKQECLDFRTRLHTIQQTYDFCNYVSKQLETEIGQFVKTLADVTQYWRRPV